MFSIETLMPVVQLRFFRHGHGKASWPIHIAFYVAPIPTKYAAPGFIQLGFGDKPGEIPVTNTG